MLLDTAWREAEWQTDLEASDFSQLGALLCAYSFVLQQNIVIFFVRGCILVKQAIFSGGVSAVVYKELLVRHENS